MSFGTKTRTWGIVAALLCLPILLYPPWRDGGHAWLFSGLAYGSLDYGRLVLELGVVCLIATLVLLLVTVQRWTWLRGIASKTVGRGLLWICAVVLVLASVWVVLHIPKAFPADELALVTGEGAPTGNTFYGTVYNGSKTHVVREITIRLTFRPSPSSAAAADERDYQVRDLWVPPLGAATFSAAVISLPGVQYDQWQIVSAWGIRNYWPM